MSPLDIFSPYILSIFDVSFARAIYFACGKNTKVHRSRQEGERLILQEVHDPWITLATNASS